MALGHDVAQMMTTRSPRAGKELTFAAQRSTPAGGRYQAMASLMSFAFGAAAFASVQSH